MTKPTLYLIHGYIASGKTTYAKKLEGATNAIRFTLDEWIVHFYGDNPPIDRFDQYESDVKDMIWKMAKKFLQNKTSVILDYGFWKLEDREGYRKQASHLNALCELHVLNLDEKIALERLNKRTNQMPDGALFIDENAYYSLKSKYEPIEPDEDHIMALPDT